MALSTQSDESPSHSAASSAVTGRRERPVLYAAFVVAAILAAFIYELRTNGIFACQATGYTAGSYLAYCNATGYGDYDHGAFWFNYESGARQLASEAQVLFLGSSRMEFAFSSDATDEWFAARKLTYYLLGFSHTENIKFAAPLLQQISPRAKAYVINADGFFDDRETEPVTQLFHGDTTESRYHRKRLWQYPHRVLCGAFSALCGHDLAFFRTRTHGTWVFDGNQSLVRGGIADAPVKDPRQLERRIKLADAFVAALPVPRSCVLLTVAPWAETPRAEAGAIAEALGVRLFAPRVEGLGTFDGSHLDDPSAELWSRQFFEVAGGEIQRCSESSAAGPHDADGSAPQQNAR